MPNRTKMNAARGLVFVIGALIITILTLTLLIGGQLLLVRRKWGQWYGLPLMHAWGRSLIWLAGCKLEILNANRLQDKSPCVVAANHSSYLDIYVLVGVLNWNIRFVMKKQLFWQLLIVGWYLLWRGHYFLDRGTSKKSRARAARLAHRMSREINDEGAVPLVFPEGTRSPDGTLHKLHPGTLKPAVEAGVDLQPIAVLGTETMPKGRFWPKYKSGTVLVVVGKRIPTAGKKTVQVCADLRAALLAMGVPDGELSEATEIAQ